MRSGIVLALLLAKKVWGTETGFAYRGYLFLNDSLSLDDRQEYAVFRVTAPGNAPTQVESFVVSGRSVRHVYAHIRAIVHGACDARRGKPITLRRAMLVPS